MSGLKKITIILLFASILIFSACGVKGSETTGKKVSADESISNGDVIDGEDVELERPTVNVANTTGKDAVKLVVKHSNGDTWSDNLLQQEYLHDGNAVPIYYTVSEDNVYDIRLYFEDGSYEDITGVDFTQEKSFIYVNTTEEAK